MNVNTCESCAIKKCMYAHLHENLFFCFSPDMDVQFMNEDVEFYLFPSFLNVVHNGINLCTYDIINTKFEYYFQTITFDGRILLETIMEIFDIIGYDPEIAANVPDKITDVYSFLRKKKFQCMQINETVLEHLNEHNIICVGFKNDL